MTTEIPLMYTYSFYVEKYVKMNLEEFKKQAPENIDNLRNEYFKLKKQKGNNYIKDYLEEIKYTMSRIAVFHSFMRDDTRKPILDREYLRDRLLREKIYENSNKTPPPINNDISEEDEFYALGKNYQQHLSEKAKIDEVNFTVEESERFDSLRLNSNFSDEEEAFRQALDTVLSERKNTKN